MEARSTLPPSQARSNAGVLLVVVFEFDVLKGGRGEKLEALAKGDASDRGAFAHDEGVVDGWNAEFLDSGADGGLRA